jgi:CRISPR/Cas system CSM-associated protein Csm5 (group 7 of RAMP superfamily)
LGEDIMGSNKFVLLEPVVFNIVLFQAMGYETVEANERVKDAINATGKVYISGTKWKGQGALRIAICNHLVPANAEEEAAAILKILGSVVP